MKKEKIEMEKGDTVYDIDGNEYELEKRQAVLDGLVVD